jgi:hypothetical protein
LDANILTCIEQKKPKPTRNYWHSWQSGSSSSKHEALSSNPSIAKEKKEITGKKLY